ncbi:MULTISPECIES: AAA family ATPase [Streptomycetaceae]|uniref:PlmR4 n=1 Tax=Streptantibioticus cattleyicolor (strain ATCC 35852 / DSM 46488 / JCM 4925 / NBRC 14057 / NRRL 8057) TaxID=1003195 RepID=F8JQT4_STREN|nr:AAA family ATPase [Streptantibioticus cattleyicolor]AEW92816.1 PlmR4 [Streptantibioticus cattleyicolor NRRL 8057 = DSM 46488]MYS57575.1 AAA family ATPase [Streptomyces sp. SID5468]CCB73169.1 PlmR4 [Streptantibioticus cattleyicolor NRRL 8057 = DSM 46488]
MAPRTDTELVRGGTAAHLDHAEECLLGRERELAEVAGWLEADDGPRLVLLRGERGVGRSASLRALAGRLRAAGGAALSLTCVPGDAERWLLLAWRLVSALEEHRAATVRQRTSGNPAAEALTAVEQGDPAAMADALTAALSQQVPVVVLVDDAQHADAGSLAVLGGLAVEGLISPVRLVVTAVEQPAAVAAVTALGGKGWARSLTLAPLEPEQVAEAVARRLRAVPDPDLARRVHHLSQGIPGAVDTVLTGWAEQGAIRVADGHAFLGPNAPDPVPSDGDRFVTALRALGEPCWTVASALSVLWPLGQVAEEITAALTGLSAEDVAAGLDTLAGAGVVRRVPAREAAPAGWAFRVPLTAHAVAARLGPLHRRRLAAAAVEALWARYDAGTKPVLLEGVDPGTYLPDRIADAGPAVDRERAVADLTAAAERAHPGYDGPATLRRLRAAHRLTEDPAGRELAWLRYALTAFATGDLPIARTATEKILRNPAEYLTTPMLQDAVSVLVAATAAGEDWTRLSRMTSARWWKRFLLPAPVALSGQVLALCLVERWREVLELLDRTEPVWTADPHGRAILDWARTTALEMLGRADRRRGELPRLDMPGLPPDTVYSLTVAQTERLLGEGELAGAVELLSTRGLAPEALPGTSAFLMLYLRGRWDEALTLARRMLATDRAFTAAPSHHLLPSRTAGIMLARGRTTSARRLLESVRGRQEGPLQHHLDHVEAEVLRTLGDPDAAEEVLRRGLDAARERGYVHGTAELWASLTEVCLETGRAEEAARCLRRLEEADERLRTGRTRLLCLLTSARVLREEDPRAARLRLREAVELARERGQPFETAVTLTAAVAQDAAPETALGEAYELFGATRAALWRFHTRTAMRAAGLAVPGRRQATEENEHLLATLITEGLTNRQISAVLRLSEDAVANRLTRLFTRTGLRSRTEVVTAVLTGTLSREPGR